MRTSGLEVADIFQQAGSAYRQQHAESLSRGQRCVMSAIERCRTAALGGHVEQCDSCGHQRIAYNSCRNRHCLEVMVCGDYRIQYVELAMDFEVLTAERAKLSDLLAFFDKHIVDEKPTKKEDKFYWAKAKAKATEENHHKGDEEGTRYYAPRKSGKVLVMYMRDSKLNDHKACLHLERRFSGLGQLKKQGIITLPQLMAFDHVNFWNSHLDLREPNLTVLGQKCSSKWVKTSRQADHRRGQQKWNELKVLQQFLQGQPHCAAAFTQITTASKLGSFLGNALPWLKLARA